MPCQAQWVRSAQLPCSCPLIRFSLDVTELGSDPEQDDVEKRSQSCLQPHVSLQLPKGERGAWSSSQAGTVIKVEIEPLRPDLVASPGLQEVVSVEGWAQQGKLGVQKAAHTGVSCRLDSFNASVEPGGLQESQQGWAFSDKLPYLVG